VDLPGDVAIPPDAPIPGGELIIEEDYVAMDQEQAAANFMQGFEMPGESDESGIPMPGEEDDYAPLPPPKALPTGPAPELHARKAATLDSSASLHPIPSLTRSKL